MNGPRPAQRRGARTRPRARSRSIYLPPWRIDVTTRPHVPSPLATSRLSAAVAAALESAAAPKPASIGVILSDDRELAELNERAMGRSEPTDVLSFPLLPADAFPRHPGASTRPRRDPSEQVFVLPPGRRPHLGDIVISVERAIEQAESGRGGQAGDVRWSAADELRLLVTHGVLHVCGWDHEQPQEEKAMRQLEAQLLEQEGNAGSGSARALRPRR